MKKILYAIIFLSLTLFFCGFVDVPRDPSYIEKEVPVVRNLGMESGAVTLRFYDTLPNVAYISAADFLDMWIPGTEMIVKQTAPAHYELTSPTGKAVVNTDEDSFYSEDFAAFTNLMGLVQDGMSNTYYDGMPFVKFVSIESEPSAVPVTFDFKAYDIDLYGESDAVYFPFVLLSDMYSDLFYHHAGFNGEKVVLNYSNFDMFLDTIDPSYSAPLGQDERPEDLARFTYNELCFALDHFYGRPGREPLHDALNTSGLDEALDSYGEAGAVIKQYLQSTDTAELYAGMNCLNNLFYDGGHTHLTVGIDTVISSREDMREISEKYSDLLAKMQERYPEIFTSSEPSDKYFEDWKGLSSLRNQSFEIGETYIKQGDTAVCVFDSFNARNQEAWDAYYAGTGPMPAIENTDGDAMVIFLDALYKAQADPEVRNLVIDISANMGGSADVVMAMASLITGKSELRYENALTGQKSVVTYAVDRNFDGSFDEKDEAVHFDLNFAVLTSRVSFSCGNLFPSLMRDAGILLLGEQSGGGACAVAFLNIADGYDYLVSSWRARLINEVGENIDSGVPVDVELANHDKRIEILVYGYDQYGNPRKEPFVMDDYRSFYDIETLSQMINEAYTVPAELVPAAN